MLFTVTYSSAKSFPSSSLMDGLVWASAVIKCAWLIAKLVLIGPGWLRDSSSFNKKQIKQMSMQELMEHSGSPSHCLFPWKADILSKGQFQSKDLHSHLTESLYFSTLLVNMAQLKCKGGKQL